MSSLISRLGADTVIDVGDGDMLPPTGITATDLTAARFDFFA